MSQYWRGCIWRKIHIPSNPQPSLQLSHTATGPNPLYLTPTSSSSFDIMICPVLAVFGKYGQLYLSRAHESISLLVTAPVPQPPSRHCYDLLWDPIFRRRFQIFIGCCINISNIATQTFFCSVGKVRLFFNQLSVVKYVLKISNF